MGACDFSNLVVIKGKARDAYHDAVEDAEYEDGHDPYNGTISTTNGFSMRSDNPRYGTKAFDKWEEKVLDETDKRECVCVEITGAVATRIKNRRGYKGKKGIGVFYFFGMASC
jgi:hypothetical protein